MLAFHHSLTPSYPLLVPFPHMLVDGASLCALPRVLIVNQAGRVARVGYQARDCQCQRSTHAIGLRRGLGPHGSRARIVGAAACQCCSSIRFSTQQPVPRPTGATYGSFFQVCSSFRSFLIHTSHSRPSVYFNQ